MTLFNTLTIGGTLNEYTNHFKSLTSGLITLFFLNKSFTQKLLTSFAQGCQSPSKFTIVWTTVQWSMKNIDIIWLAVLTIVLTHLNILFYLIRSYFKDKPLGTQSLLDVITIDNAVVSQFTGSVSTLTSIITRFETVKQFSALSPLFVSAICTLYTFAFVSICVHGTCLCFIRTLCLTNLSFIEEMIGENLIRILMNGITLLMAISACTAQIISGEINSGTAYILLTEKIFKTGF